MATSHLISVAEYLNTSYSPDVDYVDGAIEVRALGEFDHSEIQSHLLTVLRGMAKQWGIRANAELRVQVSQTRFRVPDICVMDAGAPREQIVRTPPLLCVEVLSPEDTLSNAILKAQDFLQMGVREVWIFDPVKRVVHVCTGKETEQRHNGPLKLQNTAVSLSIEHVFSTLD